MEVSRKLHEAYKNEEDCWQQKSQNICHTSGDFNTNFYQALSKQRRARNSIVGLHDEGGHWITEDKGVENGTVDNFDDLFHATSPSEFEGFLYEITPTITPQLNQRLIRNAMEDEVKQALFRVHPEKAPGPDEMTSFFPTLLAYCLEYLLDLVNNFLSLGKWTQG